MKKNYYVRFKNSNHSIQYSFEDYSDIFLIALHYKKILSVSGHRYGTTLYVAFTKSFLSYV